MNDYDHQDAQLEQEHGAAADDNGAPSHAQAFDLLRRIGELEDEKQSLQGQIDDCVAQLKSMAEQIEPGSLLYTMLQSAFPKSKPVIAAVSSKPARKRTPRKTAKK